MRRPLYEEIADGIYCEEDFVKKSTSVFNVEFWISLPSTAYSSFPVQWSDSWSLQLPFFCAYLPAIPV